MPLRYIYLWGQSADQDKVERDTFSAQIINSGKHKVISD